MAYDLKSVFYLDTSATITKATAGGGSAQLDLSAYIDPIARGRTRGTGLAVYKAHFSIINSEDSNEIAPEDSEGGVLSYSLQAGVGVGDKATGDATFATSGDSFAASNNLLVAAGNYYGPASYPGSDAMPQDYMMPSKDVPYVIVRDNVCLLYNVSASKTFESTSTIAVRLECAQISLDQATLNQLLRTQTV
tara:strand:+ start:415 stop:990 length:576 start_codon:yes stop_codon:yes gene_type:complete